MGTSYIFKHNIGTCATQTNHMLWNEYCSAKHILERNKKQNWQYIGKASRKDKGTQQQQQHRIAKKLRDFHLFLCMRDLNQCNCTKGNV